MVFQWKTSLQNCFRFYKQNLGMMLGISVLLTLCELAFITMLQHSYWIIDFFPVYLLFFVFLFQYAVLVGTVRIHQAFISYSNEIVKSGRTRFKLGFDNTKGRFLRGIKSYLTVFMIVLIPALAYYLTVVYVKHIATRTLVSTVLLLMVFFLANSYQFIQLAATMESKVVNDLKISTMITQMHFKSTLLYSFVTIYWLLVPMHVWFVREQGHIHFCGCTRTIQYMAIALTILRPIWLLLQVQVYAYVRKTHFPVPEMDPDLRDRNII